MSAFHPSEKVSSRRPMPATPPRSKTDAAVCPSCGRCPCCGMDAAQVGEALDQAIWSLLRFSLKRWRALRHETPAGVDLDIVRVAYAEAHLIRQEFREIIGGDERC